MKKIGILGTLHDEIFGVHQDYLSWISIFGEPVIISPEQDFSYRIDALVLKGGSDINPVRYNEIPGYYTGNEDPFQSWFDTKILPNLIGNLPIFGICRGLQTLNVLFGGTLYQNLEYHPHSTHKNDLVHKVKIGKELNRVNSFHHQAIDNLGKGIVVECVSEDRVIEAISNSDLKIFGVQWHPERCLDAYSIKKFSDILEK